MTKAEKIKAIEKTIELVKAFPNIRTGICGMIVGIGVFKESKKKGEKYHVINGHMVDVYQFFSNDLDLTKKEIDYIKLIIYHSDIRYAYNKAYLFEPGKKEPRIDWLKARLNELKLIE